MQHLDPSNATVSELGAYDPTRYFPYDIKVHPQWETSLLDSHLTLIWVKPLLNHMKIKVSCCRKWRRWSYSVSPYIWPKSSGWFFLCFEQLPFGNEFPHFQIPDPNLSEWLLVIRPQDVLPNWCFPPNANDVPTTIRSSRNWFQYITHVDELSTCSQGVSHGFFPWFSNMFLNHGKP